MLKDHDVKISMNDKGRSIDNIVIEHYFRTLKYNCIFINDYQNIREFKEGIDNYINKYNYQRFHSSIGYKKPMNVYLDYVQNYKQMAAQFEQNYQANYANILS